MIVLVVKHAYRQRSYLGVDAFLTPRPFRCQTRTTPPQRHRWTTCAATQTWSFWFPPPRRPSHSRYRCLSIRKHKRNRRRPSATALTAGTAAAAASRQRATPLQDKTRLLLLHRMGCAHHPPVPSPLTAQGRAALSLVTPPAPPAPMNRRPLPGGGDGSRPGEVSPQRPRT